MGREGCRGLLEFIVDRPAACLFSLSDCSTVPNSFPFFAIRWHLDGLDVENIVVFRILFLLKFDGYMGSVRAR